MNYDDSEIAQFKKFTSPKKIKVSFRIFTSQNKFIHDKITCVSV